MNYIPALHEKFATASFMEQELEVALTAVRKALFHRWALTSKAFQLESAILTTLFQSVDIGQSQNSSSQDSSSLFNICENLRLSMHTTTSRDHCVMADWDAQKALIDRGFNVENLERHKGFPASHRAICIVSGGDVSDGDDPDMPPLVDDDGDDPDMPPLVNDEDEYWKTAVFFNDSAVRSDVPRDSVEQSNIPRDSVEQSNIPQIRPMKFILSNEVVTSDEVVGTSGVVASDKVVKSEEVVTSDKFVTFDNSVNVSEQYQNNAQCQPQTQVSHHYQVQTHSKKRSRPSRWDV